MGWPWASVTVMSCTTSWTPVWMVGIDVYKRQPMGKIGLDEARAAFAEQIQALAEGGADLLTIETMTSLAEAGEAIRAAREAAPQLRVVVMMTVGEDGNCLDLSLIHI